MVIRVVPYKPIDIQSAALMYRISIQPASEFRVVVSVAVIWHTGIGRRCGFGLCRGGWVGGWFMDDGCAGGRRRCRCKSVVVLQQKCCKMTLADSRSCLCLFPAGNEHGATRWHNYFCFVVISFHTSSTLKPSKTLRRSLE